MTDGGWMFFIAPVGVAAVMMVVAIAIWRRKP
jgi:hypothetical protein